MTTNQRAEKLKNMSKGQLVLLVKDIHDVLFYHQGKLVEHELDGGDVIQDVSLAFDHVGLYPK